MRPIRLLCLHGFSQNGAMLRSHLTDLTSRLPAHVEPDFPDAPHECSEESVARLASMLNDRRPPPPHRCFWNATDDGREYRGWPVSRELLRERAASAPRVGLLGFSQGAIASAALCALAAHDQFPKLAFAVLIAGRQPRSDELGPLFATPLAIPTLHVWGERDAFAKDHSPKLVECFDAAQREVVTWRGPHMVPTRGPVADAIVSFIEKHT